ncbi:hypothetical protein G5714_014785 [Onychostoma macrolepis]|uniref:Uncharacterized protein n=1 Tax=Onychostoma macrolepis TaxID=369639 RepID=A0A7J6C914_9TELE|nr:hypothetical protein G5714_014785 [Onychostoma macrolepis]
MWLNVPFLNQNRAVSQPAIDPQIQNLAKSGNHYCARPDLAQFWQAAANGISFHSRCGTDEDFSKREYPKRYFLSLAARADGEVGFNKENTEKRDFRSLVMPEQMRKLVLTRKMPKMVHAGLTEKSKGDDVLEEYEATNTWGQFWDAANRSGYLAWLKTAEKRISPC